MLRGIYHLTTLNNMAKIDTLFKLMNEQGASDLHLISGSQPILRVHGDMERVDHKSLENDELNGFGR